MNIAIIGASGFLGYNLAQRILETTKWNIRVVARNKDKLERIGPKSSRLELVQANVLDYGALESALEDIDVAYYFVHMMGHKERDFYEAELEAAHTFVKAAKQAKVKRVIYMGGLGNNANNESKHLHSRHRTGEILRTSLPNVIEFRASMIIGHGSVAYDIIRNIVHKLPVILLPRSVETKTQPIALNDALRYLMAGASIKKKGRYVVDIGGPQVMSYADIYREYADFSGKHRGLIKIPDVSPFMAGAFLDLLTPKIHARIGATMAESMTTEMTVQNDSAKKLFSHIQTVPIRTAFEQVEHG